MKKLIVSIMSLCAILLVACDSSGQAVPSPQPAATTATTILPSPAISAAPTDVAPSGTAMPEATDTSTPQMMGTVTDGGGVGMVFTPMPSETATATDAANTTSPIPTSANTPTSEAPATQSNMSGGIVIPVGIDYPPNNSQVTLPLHVQVHLSRHKGDITIRLRWPDGQELSQKYTPRADQFDNYWLVDSLDWTGEGPPPDWKSGPATLQVLDASGAALVTKTVTYLSSGDPGTMQVKLYWYAGESLQQVTRTITRTQEVANAAVSELLWGIGPRNFAGFTSAIPSPQQVLAYQGRTADWGPRVTLRTLIIANGVATVDLSREAQAFGGGSTAVNGINSQIEATLKQFSSVKSVQITVEGSSTVLQP